MVVITSQITSLTIVYSTVYSDADQRRHQSSTSLAFVWGIHRGPVNSPHKWPVTQKMFPFDDDIMEYESANWTIIASGNGFSPVQYQAITLASANFLLIGPLKTNFSEIIIHLESIYF